MVMKGCKEQKTPMSKSSFQQCMQWAGFSVQHSKGSSIDRAVMRMTFYTTINCHSNNYHLRFNCVFVVDNYISVWLVGFEVAHGRLDTQPKDAKK